MQVLQMQGNTLCRSLTCTIATQPGSPPSTRGSRRSSTSRLVEPRAAWRWWVHGLRSQLESDIPICSQTKATPTPPKSNLSKPWTLINPKPSRTPPSCPPVSSRSWPASWWGGWLTCLGRSLTSRGLTSGLMRESWWV